MCPDNYHCSASYLFSIVRSDVFWEFGEKMKEAHAMSRVGRAFIDGLIESLHEQILEVPKLLQ